MGACKFIIIILILNYDYFPIFYVIEKCSNFTFIKDFNTYVKSITFVYQFFINNYAFKFDVLSNNTLFMF